LDRKPESRTRWPRRRILVVLFGIVVAFGAIVFTRELLDSSRVRIAAPQDLSAHFETIGYTSKRLRAGDAEVPRFVVSDIPEDWAEGLTVDRKKSLFFRALLPMVLMVNEEILRDRKRLQAIGATLAESRSASSDDLKWLMEVAERYGLPIRDRENNLSPTSIKPLLHRVDVIPPSLALAQAAVESAYASSRFAVEGNALFGQWHLGKGLVPGKQRTELGDYRVATFRTPKDSIRSYMKNLNTNAAYRSFRELRAAARRQDQNPRGAPLADRLLAYSEKGAAYVSLVRNLIARNGLSAADSARLKDHQTTRITTGPL